MKHKTAELEGALLDAAVALAEGDRLPDYWRDPDDGTCWLRPGREEWSPSTRWEQGGEIIERERITVQASQAGDWRAFSGDGTTNAGTGRGAREHIPQARGPTPLIAAMRAYVASKFGPEIDLP